MQSVLSADASYILLAVVCGSAAVGYAIDSSRLDKKVPGVLVAVLIPMLLTAGGIIPSAAPLYDAMGAFLVPLAVALLLLDADLRKIARVGAPLLAVFAVACLGTLAGVLISGQLFDLGADRAAMSAVMAGTYIGGSSNLLAISQMVDWSTPNAVSVAFAADAVGGMTFIGLIMLLPGVRWLRRLLPSKVMDAALSEPASSESDVPSMTLNGAFFALALATVIVAASYAIAPLLGIGRSALLVVSLIALFIGNLFPARFARTRDTETLGTLMIYLFMPVIGAITDLRTLTGTAIEVVAFALSIVAIHVVVLGVAARVFRFDLAAALVASNAAILGPATAAAMASSLHWRSLVAPGLMCGLLGNAVANFIGMAVYRLLTP